MHLLVKVGGDLAANCASAAVLRVGAAEKHHFP
jgi:hypothetical protein